MKFAKVLRSELVPEWKKAYIDYKELKRLITYIKRSLGEQQSSQQSQQQSDQQSRQEQERCESLNANGSILTNSTEISIPIPEQTGKRLSNLSSKSSSFIDKIKSFSKGRKSPLNSSRKQSPLISYDTLWEQVNPQEKKFFEAIEENLDKVEKFYEMKLSESLKRFDELVEQYKIMKESRIKKKLKENEAWPKKLSLIMREIEHLPTSPKSKSVSFTTQEDDGQFAETKFHIKHDLDYKSAKKLIKKALLEFYRGIILLKNYGILNKTGFIKILKKYDKATKRNGREIYLPRISNFNFANLSSINNLVQETENFYINNFEQGARGRAMKKLRLPNKGLNTYYFVTWRVGLYIGLSIPILVRAIELAFRNKLSFDPIKWPILLQIYCAYLIPIVFALLIGINMYTWTKAGINYKFIFEFNPRHNLNYRQYCEIPAFMLLVYSFTTYVGFTFVKFEQCVWILGIILLSILICPLRIFYYDARKWFIIAMLRVVASGFYRVEFRDFFIADELNSLTYTFMNSQFLFCAINVCKFSPLSPLLTSLPPWWRFVQCLKRYSLTYHKYPHLLNAGKYFSTIVTVWLLFLFRTHNNKITKSLWISGQSISSIYSYLWDVLMDWSLLQLDSQNYLLRDELNFKNHAIYYFAIVSDGLLRFSWTLQLIIPSEYAIATVFVIACGEMLRRWQWNFFRVENEHINNCGQFRAIKEIPLPFERETTNDELNVPSEPQVIKLSSRITNAYLPQRRAGFPHQTDDIQGWRDFQPRSNAISYACSDVTDDEHSDNNSLDDRISQFETPLKDESNRNNNNGHYGSSGTSAIESDAERA